MNKQVISLLVKTTAQSIPAKKLLGTKGYLKITVLADNFFYRFGDNTAPLNANTSVTSSAMTDDGTTVQYTGTALTTGLKVGDIVQVTSGADVVLGYAQCVEIVTGTTVVKFRKISSAFTATSGDKIIKFKARTMSSTAPVYLKLENIEGDDGYVSLLSDNGSATGVNVRLEQVDEIPPTVYGTVNVASVTAGS